MATRLPPTRIAIAFLCAVAFFIEANAQIPIPPVDFTPFSDGQHWIVKQPLTYIVGESKDSVTVPVGFVTDLASIPWYFHSIIQKNGNYLLPAVVHDYLYWKQTCTRQQSDGIMRLAMIENNVSVAHQIAIYEVLRIVGGFAWDSNTAERAARVLRILPPTHFKIPANTKWDSYREQLMKAKVAEGEDFSISPRFCARGDMPVDVALHTP